MGTCSSCAQKPIQESSQSRSGHADPLFYMDATLPRGSKTADLESLVAFFAKAPDAKVSDIPRILRFTRARSHRVDDALAMWHTDQEWRARENLAGILDEKVSPAVEEVISGLYEPICLDGRSHDGRMVMYRKLGTIDVDVLKDHPEVGLHDLARRHTREMERLRIQMESDVTGVGALGGHLSIFDLHGTSLGKFLGARAFWQLIGGVDSMHYAEMLGTCLIINPPALTHFAINTIKPFLDPVTAHKIVVRDGPPSVFMHEYMDVVYLPLHLRPQGVSTAAIRVTVAR